MGVGVDFDLFWRSVSEFSDFVGLETGLKIDGQQKKPTPRHEVWWSQSTPALRAIQAFQVMIADLQPATSRPGAAEKQATWTGDC